MSIINIAVDVNTRPQNKHCIIKISFKTVYCI